MDELVSELSTTCRRVIAETQKVVVGQQRALERMLIALLAQGHALLEGVPGTAKTLMVRALAESLGLSNGRIQFTPDLMPNDIVGTHVFDMATSTFHLQRGPIFTELLLADEINRAPAKTQSALLQAMQERQVSIDGKQELLPAEFTVFATQNPVEHEGTYPLPEAELDRFLVKVRVGYPSADEEDEILRRATATVTMLDPREHGVSPQLTRAQLVSFRELANRVRIDDGVRHYARDLVRQTRASSAVTLGAGPRAGVHLLVAARWTALLLGRAFVTPDDVRSVCHEVLAHRLTLSAEAELEGDPVESVLDRILERVQVPR